MRVLAIAGAATAVVCLSGCADSRSRYDYSASDPYGGPPPECAVPREAWSAMVAIHDDNESKVHELIKCGGVQTSMSRTFLVVVVASNRDLFNQQSYDDLVEFAGRYGVDLRVPFNREPGGKWTLPINAVTDSTFTVMFHDPKNRALIEEDPFVIDSYLTGVTATSSLTIDQMKADLAAQNEITFAWEGHGPLAHVLNRGEAIPNPFTIRVSFLDLAEFVWGSGIVQFLRGSDVGTGAELGPIDSVRDLEVDSEVVLNDSINGTNVEYVVTGLLRSIRDVASQGVPFAVQHAGATNGAYSLEGSATNLRYAAGPGSLVGRFDYRVKGPDGDLMVTDAYGTATGLEVRWSCPK